MSSMDKKKRIIELGLRYKRMGFNALPVSTSSKHPTGFRWKSYRVKPPNKSEFEYLCGLIPLRDLGLCILTGKKSGNLVVLDIDSDYLAFTHFFDLFNRTLACRTKHGFHFYFIVSNLDKNSQGYNNQPIDTRDEGGLVVVPPHKSRHWIGKFSRKRILRITGMPDILRDRGIPYIDMSEVDHRTPKERRQGGTHQGSKRKGGEVQTTDRKHRFDFEVLLHLAFMGRRLEDFMKSEYPMFGKTATEYQCCFCNTDITDIRCPLVIYPDTQSFYCHRCYQTGNIIDMVMNVYDMDYIAACKKLKSLKSP